MRVRDARKDLPAEELSMLGSCSRGNCPGRIVLGGIYLKPLRDIYTIVGNNGTKFFFRSFGQLRAFKHLPGLHILKSLLFVSQEV